MQNITLDIIKKDYQNWLDDSSIDINERLIYKFALILFPICP